MDDYDKTTRLTANAFDNNAPGSLLVTIFDGAERPKTISLNGFGKNYIAFGRSDANDIILSSPLVSREHGRFCFRNGQWKIEDKALYADRPSENGLIYNNAAIRSRTLCEGDFIRIDDGVETISEGVLFVFSAQESSNRWNTLELGGKPEIRIGRDTNCDIMLPHISVSRIHARIVL